MTRLVLTYRIYKLNNSGQELQFHTNSIMTRLVLTDRIYKMNKSGQELQFHTNSICTMTRLVHAGALIFIWVLTCFTKTVLQNKILQTNLDILSINQICFYYIVKVLLPTCFLDFCALLALMLKYFCIWFWFLIGSTFHCI